MSTPPSSRSTVANAASTSPGSPTSARWNTPPTDSATSRPASSVRSTTPTRAPSAARRSAVALPIPDAAPVISATLPSSAATTAGYAGRYGRHAGHRRAGTTVRIARCTAAGARGCGRVGRVRGGGRAGGRTVRAMSRAVPRGRAVPATCAWIEATAAVPNSPRPVREVEAHESVALERVGVWIDGRPHVTGVARRGAPRQSGHDRSTIFAVGNVYEAMTSTMLLQLVEQGRVHLDDRVSKWFPSIPNADQVTLADVGAQYLRLRRRRDERTRSCSRSMPTPFSEMAGRRSSSTSATSQSVAVRGPERAGRSPTRTS